ncbi:MAG: MurR/RpiR family transcriptional regulator [Fusobacteriaceae bacterium]
MKKFNKVFKRIEENSNNFTKSEIKIMEFMLKNPKFILHNSIGEISNVIGVSDATITRFSRTIGFKGFNELKFVLEQELQRIEIEESDLNNNLILDKLLTNYTQILQKMVNLLKESNIDKLLTLLKTSKRIKIYGVGSSGYFAEEIYFRLSKLGFDVRAITESHEMKIDANFSKNNDLIIGVSLSGLTNVIIESMALAKANGAKTVSLTNYPDSKISEVSDEIITIAQKNLMEMGHFISPQIALLFTFDYLFSEIILEDSEKYFEMGFNTMHNIFNSNDLK